MNQKEEMQIRERIKLVAQQRIDRALREHDAGKTDAVQYHVVLPLMIADAITASLDEYDKIVEARRFGGPVE